MCVLLSLAPSIVMDDAEVGRVLLRLLGPVMPAYEITLTGLLQSTHRLRRTGLMPQRDRWESGSGITLRRPSLSLAIPGGTRVSISSASPAQRGGDPRTRSGRKKQP